MKRKLIAFMAAILALLSASPCVLAKSTTGVKNGTVITGSFVYPDVSIEVTVPTGTSAYLNPKKVTVKNGATMTDDGIITVPSYIENKSHVPISVNVYVTGSVKSGSKLVLVDSLDGLSSVNKGAYVYFQMQKVTDPENVSWSGVSDSIIVHRETESREDFVRLEAGDQDGRYGAFRLSGECSKNPTDSWTSKDALTATVVFTFRAVPNA